MNYDFSIEASRSSIHNPKTREYFNEVYHTFANGNYRSSIVMLYSVLICDLVFKLRDLRDLYKDDKAKKILDEIEALQAANPRAAEWETKLIDFIQARISLLEASDIVAIESLQKFRHLSAHPVLTNADLLYSPNKETAQALIRNILEGVLTNAPFFSNKIFSVFVSDLADIKNKITDDEEALDRYLSSRYLRHLKDLDFSKLFRSLWRIVFITDDELSKENRKINFRALNILFKQKRDLCVRLIKGEPHYYSNITKETPIFNLSILLGKVPEVFNVIDEPLRLLLQKAAEKSDKSRFISSFLHPSIEDFLKSLNPKEFPDLGKKEIKHVTFLAKENGLEKLIRNFLIRWFGESKNYTESRDRFKEHILPLQNDVDLDDIQLLLQVSNSNDQIYGKIGMDTDLVRFSETKFPGAIEVSKYPKIYPQKPVATPVAE